MDTSQPQQLILSDPGGVIVATGNIIGSIWRFHGDGGFENVTELAVTVVRSCHQHMLRIRIGELSLGWVTIMGKMAPNGRIIFAPGKLRTTPKKQSRTTLPIVVHSV